MWGRLAISVHTLKKSKEFQSFPGKSSDGEKENNPQEIPSQQESTLELCFIPQCPSPHNFFHAFFFSLWYSSRP